MRMGRLLVVLPSWACPRPKLRRRRRLPVLVLRAAAGKAGCCRGREEVMKWSKCAASVKEGRHTRVGRHWGRGSAAARGEEGEAQTEAARRDEVFFFLL
jgi:predicted Fe-S protein YdhL (DUF1289 family)